MAHGVRSTPAASTAPGGANPACRPLTGAYCGRFYNDIQCIGGFGGLLTGAFYKAKLSTAALPVFRPAGKENGKVAVLEGRYALSKRTALYAEYDNAKWSNGANFAIKTEAARSGLGVTQNDFSVGVTHLF